MKTVALIEKGEDGSFGIYTPDLEHTIVGDGATVALAKADFENSVKEMIASYTESGEEIPKELVNVTFDYKYDVASVFNYYDFINVSKFARKIGINTSLMHQYKSGKQYISETQMNKIETGLHKIGEELLSVHL